MSIKINEARLESKDNELIKTHSVIDKLKQEVLTVTVKESESKIAVRRMTMLEERVKEIKTLKLQAKEFQQKSQTTEVTLASKDVEFTVAYGIIDSFKKDILTLTDQLEAMKSLRHQRN